MLGEARFVVKDVTRVSGNVVFNPKALATCSVLESGARLRQYTSEWIAYKTESILVPSTPVDPISRTISESFDNDE